jgi:ribosomal protein S18 acetylase RimI-like enzyme
MLMTSCKEPATTAAAIRQLGPADWAQLRETRLAALAEAPYAFASTLAREEGFTEETWRSRTQTSAVFAAWTGPAIAGTASVLILEDGGWHIVGMWVSPALRGGGVAHQLLAAACDYARGQGAGSITLWVTEVNERARAFYRRFGFAPTGGRQLVRPEDPDHWEEELAMALG